MTLLSTTFPTLVPADVPALAATLAQVTTSGAPGAPTTTFPLVPAEPATSATGSVVFGIVVLIIVVGALVLYLRNRRAAPGSQPGPS